MSIEKEIFESRQKLNRQEREWHNREIRRQIQDARVVYIENLRELGLTWGNCYIFPLGA